MNDNNIDIIFKITQALANMDDAKLLMEDVLGLLKENGLEYAAIKVVDPASEEIIIKYASGLSEEERQRGRYKLGEGITGTVVKTGEPIVIQDTSEDPRFLNRTGASDHDHSSFYCFPIQIEGNTVGALSALSKYIDHGTYDAQILLLKTVTPMIAQSLRLSDKIQQDRRKWQQENQHLRYELKSLKSLDNFVGTSSKMQQVFEQIKMVSDSNATVMIRGENGTGKELVADNIHYSSYRSSKPFIKVNCAALPETLLESELFGHERGAFTGATMQKKGRFELADGGTLFLDEIGEINQSVQVKLLRFLQSREFERVGGINTIQCNVRIIAATNRNLEEMIREKTFREDLYYRLNVFPVFVPPLRERHTDITLLADFFLEKFSRENSKAVRRISTPAIEMLTSYHWPGNVRELENCIERAVLVCQADTIRAQDLPPTLQMARADDAPFQNWTLPQAISNLEKEMIVEALKNNQGHQGKAADAIGITERQMGYKMKKYNVTRDLYRSPGSSDDYE